MDKSWRAAAVPTLSAAVLALSAQAMADKPRPRDFYGALAATIRHYCSTAKIQASGDEFTARSGTMVFTLHGRSMTGEYSRRTYKEEGPNYRGFLLTVSRTKGHYDGQAAVPQTVSGPYYPTYLDAVPTADGNSYYMIRFSFGSRLDPQLKKAIFDELRGG